MPLNAERRLSRRSRDGDLKLADTRHCHLRLRRSRMRQRTGSRESLRANCGSSLNITPIMLGPIKICTLMCPKFPQSMPSIILADDFQILNAIYKSKLSTFMVMSRLSRCYLAHTFSAGRGSENVLILQKGGRDMPEPGPSRFQRRRVILGVQFVSIEF